MALFGKASRCASRSWDSHRAACWHMTHDLDMSRVEHSKALLLIKLGRLNTSTTNFPGQARTKPRRQTHSAQSAQSAGSSAALASVSNHSTSVPGSAAIMPAGILVLSSAPDQPRLLRTMSAW